MILQLLPAASELQALLADRSFEVTFTNEPRETLVNFTVEVPVFVTVRTSVPLPHRRTDPKLMLEGEKVRPVVTVSVTGALVTLPTVAVMFVLPAATPVATPVPEIVARVESEECQVAVLVTFCVLLSL